MDNPTAERASLTRNEERRRRIWSASIADSAESKKDCDPCDQSAEYLTWDAHGFKHLAKKIPWSDTVAQTSNGDAKYKRDVVPNVVAQEALERDAWNRGTASLKRKGWKFMKYPSVIGANAGRETFYVRVECTNPGVIHGHPTSPEQYREHTGSL